VVEGASVDQGAAKAATRVVVDSAGVVDGSEEGGARVVDGARVVGDT